MPLTVQPLQHHGRDGLHLLTADGARAQISLYGGQVTSWQPAPGRERLYLSPNATWTTGTAIRGGIPVVFPQFGGRGPLAKHGFARLSDWRFLGIDAAALGQPAAVLELSDSADTRRHWPIRFRARMHVALSASALQVGLEVRNEDTAAVTFTTALHTYLRVDSLDGAVLQGLERARYLDSTRGDTAMPAQGEGIRFNTETDCIYPDSPDETVLHDRSGRVRVRMGGFKDTVVWNPGASLAASMADLGPGEHEHFVCVEAATVVQPVTLATGESWLGWQQLVDESD